MPIKLSQHQKRPPWLTRSNVLWGTGIALGLGVAIALVAALATGKLKSGIGGGETEVTSVKTTVGAVETTTTTTPQEAKTLWDWLSLAGIPLSLAGLGFWLQLKDQKIADKNRQQDLEIAQDNREEEALQHYLDRVSNLVIEKNLLAIAAKDPPTTEEKELLDVSVDILRGLTLSTLRRLSDGVRKASVVRLLIETDIIKRVSLEGADLTGAELTGAILIGATLTGAKLEHANLTGAILNSAKLEHANLTGAILNRAFLNRAFLNRANLIGAKLEHANLTGAILNSAIFIKVDFQCADFNCANLKDANLTDAEALTKEQLEKAYLCGTKLPKGIDIDPYRDCKTDYNEWLSEHSEWLSQDGST